MVLSQNSRLRSYILVEGATTTGLKLPTNFIETLIPMVQSYFGPAIFASGSAFKNSGILLGPILLIHIALISLHCQHLLMKACSKVAAKEAQNRVFPSFAETVEYAFADSSYEILKKHGKLMGFVTNVFIFTAQYSYCVILFTFVCKHFTEIASANGWNVDYRVMLVIILIPMWASTFLTSLKRLIPLSLIANVLMWIGIMIIVVHSTKDLVSLDDRMLIASYKRLPLFFGIMVYSFSRTIFIIHFRVEMKEPENLLKPFGVLNMSFALVVVLYMIVGFFTYWKYGEAIEGSAILNMNKTEKIGDVTKGMIAIAILLSYSLYMYIPFEIGYSIFYRRCGPFKRPLLISGLYRSFWVIVTYVLANFSQNLEAYISLVGAFIGSILGLIVPAVLELMLDSEHPKKYVVVKNTLIILLAIVGGVVGTAGSIIEILEEYRNGTKNGE